MQSSGALYCRAPRRSSSDIVSSPLPARGHHPCMPRSPACCHAPVQCAAGSPAGSRKPRLSHRQWAPPRAVAAADVAPPSPVTPGPADAEQPQQQQSSSAEAFKPAYDCVDLATQSLAVNLTLDEYRQSLAAAAAAAPAPPAAGAPPPPPPPALAAALQSHLSLTSADLESMGLCSHCRYPCYLSGMPTCEASHYLQLWDDDAALKPRGFDASTSLRLRGIADIAAVSSGGRANGRWKPDNQDAFLVAPTASGAGAGAAIGVFDGHGRLGAAAARTVRQAMERRLAGLAAGAGADASSSADAVAASSPGVPPTAALLDGCFSAADAALVEADRDWSKSGCTAVLALLDADSVSVAWAGDSRAVLGVYDASGALAASSLASAGSMSSADAGDECPPSPSSSSSGASPPGANNILPMGSSAAVVPLCAAVPLTEDHKPDRPVERERITAAGGRVTRLATDRNGNPAGPFRVFIPNAWSPGLALSRAFGDTLAGTVGVTSKPEVTVLPLPSPPAQPSASSAGRPLSVSNAASASCCSLEGEGEGVEAPPGPSSERHVLIVASDGLWEWISNTTAVAIASGAACAEDAAHMLVEAAQKQWAVRYRGRNCDDITVVVAFLDR